MELNSIARKFEQAILGMNRLDAQNILREASVDLAPLDTIDQIIVPGLHAIGSGWQEGRVALAQVYMSGKICEELIDQLIPPGEPARDEQPKIALTVLEDYHLLGKRIVYAVLRSAGYNVLDYGRAGVDELVQRVIEDHVEVLLISTLMLPSALLIKDVREALKKEDYDLKIVVGGAPFNFDENLWREVGADAMGIDASQAIELVAEEVTG